jgi:hypothetical protein
MKKLHCLCPLMELEMVGRTVPLAAIENRSKHAIVQNSRSNEVRNNWPVQNHKLSNQLNSIYLCRWMESIEWPFPLLKWRQSCALSKDYSTCWTIVAW